MSWDQIPAELTNLNQWVVWRYEEREGKRTKVPYQTHGGRLASSTKPETWAPFAAAKAAAEGYDGIGFVFREEGGIVGIDLDGCRDAVGEVESWAWEWVMKLQSYTEVTPSGRGLHVLVHGQVPQGMKRGQVEMYDRGRYFTVTGERLENLPEVLHNREAVVMEMYEAFARPVAPSPPRSLAVNGAAPDQWSVIEKVLGSAKGGPLWRGSTADYESHSSADAALCEIIAYYAGPDSALIDQVFRQSGLYRPEKWDRPGDSYSGRTIDFVLKNRSGSPFYQWQPEAASRRTGGST